MLDPETAKASIVSRIEKMDEKDFRYRLNSDACGTEKLGEGLRAFIAETEKLEEAITSKVRSAVVA